MLSLLDFSREDSLGLRLSQGLADCRQWRSWRQSPQSHRDNGGGTSGCSEAISREWTPLCNCWASVQQERENQTTLARMFTPRCPSYNKTLACSPPQFQWPIVSSQALERGPHAVLTSRDSRVNHEMVVLLVRRLCRSHRSYYSGRRC